jgi:hypothetical protein
MPGGIKLNHGNLISQGQAEVKEVEEEIKFNANSVPNGEKIIYKFMKHLKV